MRIQHNIMAMNSYRNYNTNTAALSKNLEKLSSGYKINRAGDDAAGLAISEKMRAQITGLDAAYKNTKDATSMIKTAEGALQEVQDMLNRMVYLAEQSANGTYDNNIDRAALQDEVDALQKEIGRIASSANFNGMKLFAASENMLAYSGAAMKFQIGDSAASYDQLKMSEAITQGSLVTFGTWISTGTTGSAIMNASSALAFIDQLKGGKSISASQAWINKISKLRGNLGATQNRLDHTLKNLSVMKENIQDAESTIRDTDVAEEMMAYTKNNILIQSAQAMLAQSNAVPQGVLQLLQ